MPNPRRGKASLPYNAPAMTAPPPAPPYPATLAPAAARRQAVACLLLLFALVYGGPFLYRAAGRPAGRLDLMLLSTLLLGAVMLLAVLLLAWGDPDWRDSLGLRGLPLRPVLTWSLLGFLGTYLANLALTAGYVLAHGDTASVAARRATYLGVLAELPLEAILPLAAFVGLWEELVFRGFLLGRLRAALPAGETARGARWRDAAAVGLTAAAFGLGHGYQGPLGLLQTGMAGLVLGAVTLRRGSLWPAVGGHLLIDLFGLLALRLLRHLS